MGNFLEQYRNNSHFRFHDKPMIFSTRDDFSLYLRTVDNPYNMGARICFIGGVKYLLEVEPWMASCVKESKYSAEAVRLAQKSYLDAHKKRLDREPDEAGFIQTIKERPRIIEVVGEEEWLGISYALLKLDEQNN